MSNNFMLDIFNKPTTSHQEFQKPSGNATDAEKAEWYSRYRLALFAETDRYKNKLKEAEEDFANSETESDRFFYQRRMEFYRKRIILNEAEIG